MRSLRQALERIRPMTLKERFLKYISVYTTSDETSNTTPSTDRQLDLAEILRKELAGIGAEDVTVGQGDEEDGRSV